MKIVKKHVDELIPASYNPRKDLQESDKEYQKIKNSISEFGYVDPIIYNKLTNTVVGGHQRLKALKELGYEEVDVVEIEESLEREKTLNIALNKIEGEWDMTMLKDLLQDLDTGNIDMNLTGFDNWEIEQLMTQYHIEWDNVDDLTEDSYEEPNKVKLECPHCHHIDSKERFKKVTEDSSASLEDDSENLEESE